MARAPQGARPEVEDIPRVSLWLKRKKGHMYFSIGFLVKINKKKFVEAAAAAILRSQECLSPPSYIYIFMYVRRERERGSC